MSDEAKRIDKLVRKRATISETLAQNDVLALAKRVCANPLVVNIEVACFVDHRRYLCDYNDVFEST